ncbi:hypothetical protein ACFVS2_34510, partial [Brevibacillus sp. NPDC058079]|uniref:hypothetical protein n=1 Tax=Brevibacillus sp. NPDC058079 TaxID=3346330 RepID=UPI0036E4FF3B
AFDAAIAAANDAKANATTQKQVDDAVVALNDAATTYNSAKKAGTQAPAVDKTALDTAVSNANTAQTGVKVSVDGTDVPAAEQWVTQAVQTAFDAAIAAANDAKANATTQKQVDDAVVALNDAVTTYNSAKKAGTL